MNQYFSIVCGYVYDQVKGDPENGIAPGTEFKDLPNSWVCPVCGSPKSDFEKVKVPICSYGNYEVSCHQAQA